MQDDPKVKDTRASSGYTEPQAPVNPDVAKFDGPAMELATEGGTPTEDLNEPPPALDPNAPPITEEQLKEYAQQRQDAFIALCKSMVSVVYTFKAYGLDWKSIDQTYHAVRSQAKELWEKRDTIGGTILVPKENEGKFPNVTGTMQKVEGAAKPPENPVDKQIWTDDSITPNLHFKFNAGDQCWHQITDEQFFKESIEGDKEVEPLTANRPVGPKELLESHDGEPA